MAVFLSPVGGAAAQFFDNSGNVLSGGKLYTYAAGTTTPQPSYTTILGTVAHTNPIILDSAGRVPSGEIWLTYGVQYKFALETSTGVLIATYDNIVGSDTNLISDLANNTDPSKGDNFIGFRQSNSAGNLTGAVGKTVHDKLQDVISVMDFIPLGTNTATTDCTPYFNLATRAAENFTGFADAFYREIFVPGGQYRIDGLVYVRKGQHLRGAGMGAAYLDFTNNVGGTNTNTGGIVLGKNSSGVADPTGLPPEVSGIFTLGGSTAIECTPAGAAIHSCFFSFPITGINYSGSDLVVTNCIFDNGTSCMFLSGQNATFSNCIFYLANQQVYIVGGANDIVFDNCVFEYPQVASIYLQNGNNKNINISGSTFLMNQQYAGHQAFIYSAASTNDSVYVSGCSFRNGKGPIYKHTSGSTYASFKACVIDGEKTIPSYVQSTTAFGIEAGGVATVDVDGCTFKNLYDTVFKVNTAGTVRVKNCDVDNSAAGVIAMSAAGGQLVVNDVAITGTGATPVTFTGTSSQSMKLDGVRFTGTGGTYDITIAGASALASVELYNIIGSGRQLFSYTGTTLFYADNLKNWLDPVVVSTSRYVKIPYVGAQTINFSITGNPNVGGNPIYRKSDYGVMCVDFDYTGISTAETYLWKNDLLTSTATGNSMPTITAELQALGAGAVSAGHVISGFIILSWPTTFTLETIMATPINGVRPV